MRNDDSSDYIMLFCWTLKLSPLEQPVNLHINSDSELRLVREGILKGCHPQSLEHIAYIGVWKLTVPLSSEECEAALSNLDPEESSSCQGVTLTKIEPMRPISYYFPDGIKHEDRFKVHLISKLRETITPSNSEHSNLAEKSAGHDVEDIPSQTLVLTPRSATVTALYYKIRRYGFVHVRGTPGSGKSVMAELLCRHIRRVVPKSPVRLISSWAPIDVKPHGWREHLSRTFNIEANGAVYLIFDEGQVTYWDSELWNDVFKSPLGKVAGAIVFASYGSPASVLSRLPTPINLRPPQLVSLSRSDNDDGTGEAGLLFTQTEFNTYVELTHPSHCFTRDFLDEIYERTVGHIGAIEMLFDIVKNTNAYRQCLPDRLPFSWDSFKRKIDPYELRDQLSTGGAFSRGLPVRSTLTQPEIANVFRTILCTGWHSDLPLKALKEAKDHKLPGLVECIERGWIQSEHANVFEDDRIVYHFASPLHAWYIQMYHGSYLLKEISCSSLLQFCLTVIGFFSLKHIASPRRINATMIQRPTEAQYQDEFYRCCEVVAPGNITFSEFGSKRGKIDFYFPMKQWGVELLRDGNDLQGHSGRFSSPHLYAGVVPITEYIILDFRHTMPTKAHPDIQNLYHVVLSADSASVQILDNQLVPGSCLSLLNV